MPESRLPRYLTAQQARTLRDELEEAVAGIRLRLTRAGADPACLDHEIAIALARAACRYDLDLLAGADDKIGRLEAAVAALDASLEQAKILAPKSNGTHVDPFVLAEARASAELAGAGVCRHPITHRERGDEFNPDRCGICHEIIP